jgi:GNAT superfamily N-acetyltransferase
MEGIPAILELTNHFKGEIICRRFEEEDKEMLIFMILSLYTEDCSQVSMDITKIDNTLKSLTSNPDRGTFLMLEHKLRIIGYCILINYWSNEYGGMIVFIDELFVVPEYRNNGIASALIKRLIQSPVNDAIALQLEVTPRNISAARLYSRLGFLPIKNKHFRLILDKK